MPLFIDRYFFFSSLSIPPLLAVLLTRAKAVCGFWFILFTLLFGYGSYHNNPEHIDEFKPLVNYINTRHQPNDAVVVSKMFDYLSYVYYNKRIIVRFFIHRLTHTEHQADRMPMALVHCFMRKPIRHILIL